MSCGTEITIDILDHLKRFPNLVQEAVAADPFDSDDHFLTYAQARGWLAEHVFLDCTWSRLLICDSCIRRMLSGGPPHPNTPVSSASTRTRKTRPR